MNQQTHLVQMLPPKQQTLEFGETTVWQQLALDQRRDCQAMIAELIHQVAKSQQQNHRHASRKDNQHG